MTNRCEVCGAKKSGCTDYCRTCKFAVRRGSRRVAAESLLVDIAGGSWWVWDAKGTVLVMGANSRASALVMLAAGGNVDEGDRYPEGAQP